MFKKATATRQAAILFLNYLVQHEQVFVIYNCKNRHIVLRRVSNRGRKKQKKKNSKTRCKINVDIEQQLSFFGVLR